LEGLNDRLLITFSGPLISNKGSTPMRPIHFAPSQWLLPLFNYLKILS
jgi:hypothetical protein